mmetsp:Transcript_10180/g.26359  ORF Transcript_10180/g.26359 Transcript_10180/m.26359 type:complete len:128 (+) Transcript_10180:2-385(+)
MPKPHHGGQKKSVNAVVRMPALQHDMRVSSEDNSGDEDMYHADGPTSVGMGAKGRWRSSPNLTTYPGASTTAGNGRPGSAGSGAVDTRLPSLVQTNLGKDARLGSKGDTVSGIDAERRRGPMLKATR